VTPCEQCRTAEARVAMTWQVRCTTLVRRLCDDCAREINLNVPFTLTPLREIDPVDFSDPRKEQD
jgi:protein-arginine kinase activator protein McsA